VRNARCVCIESDVDNGFCRSGGGVGYQGGGFGGPGGDGSGGDSLKRDGGGSSGGGGGSFDDRDPKRMRRY